MWVKLHSDVKTTFFYNQNHYCPVKIALFHSPHPFFIVSSSIGIIPKKKWSSFPTTPPNDYLCTSNINKDNHGQKYKF